MPSRFATLVLIGCASSGSVRFHASDPSYQPAPGPRPLVVLHPEDLPAGPLRSVGILEVTATSGGIERAADLAVTKGRELGCAAVIDHVVFTETSPHADASSFGARVLLVHGSGRHVTTTRSPKATTFQFDCVVHDTPNRSA